MSSTPALLDTASAGISPGRRQDTRLALLNAGVTLFLKTGYSKTGLDAVLKLVGVPKGSFYHYFDNKEAFGIEVLRHYAKAKLERLERCLTDERLTPLNRIRANMMAATAEFVEAGFQTGCLFGNLAQEMGNLPDGFRTELLGMITVWKTRHRACFAQAQALGELSPSLDPDILVDAYFMMIEGALLNAKVTHTDYPIRVAHWLFFEQLGHPLQPLDEGHENRLAITRS